MFLLSEKGVRFMSLKYELDNLSLNATEWYYIKTDIRGNEIQSIGYHSSSILSLQTDENNDTVKLSFVDGSTHVLPISKIVRIEYK